MVNMSDFFSNSLLEMSVLTPIFTLPSCMGTFTESTTAFWEVDKTPFCLCQTKLTWNLKNRFHFHYSSRKESMELSNQNKHVAREWQSSRRSVYRRQSIGTNNFQLTLLNRTRDGIVKGYMDFVANAGFIVWTYVVIIRLFRNQV